MKNGWHTLTLLTFIAFTLMACGGDDDALEDKIDTLQNDIDLLKAHVGIKTEQSPPDEVGKPPTGTLLPPARDDGRHGDDVEPPKEDVPQPVLPPLPPQKGQIIFEADGDIFAIDSDGGNLRNLTNHLAHDSHPAWSPDGKQIAFVSDRDRIPKIFVMDVNGENQRLYVDVERPGAPKWSPQGGVVVFYADTGALDNRGNRKQGLHIGGNIKPTFIRKGSDPNWSILGDIVFTLDSGGDTHEDIYVMNAHGGDPIRITNDPRNEYHPAWSPDGTHIAFVFSPPGDTGDGKEIHIMNADGSSRRNITQHPGNDHAPTWSPDGRQIAFMSNRDDTFNWEIYVMNADGSSQRNITNNPAAHDMYPDWKP